VPCHYMMDVTEKAQDAKRRIHVIMEASAVSFARHTACLQAVGPRARARGRGDPQRRLSRWSARRRARARGGLSGLAAHRR